MSSDSERNKLVRYRRQPCSNSTSRKKCEASALLSFRRTAVPILLEARLFLAFAARAFLFLSRYKAMKSPREMFSTMWARTLHGPTFVDPTRPERVRKWPNPTRALDFLVRCGPELPSQAMRRVKPAPSRHGRIGNHPDQARRRGRSII